MLFSETLFSAKRIIWQNVSLRPLDCKLIDSLNFIIVGDDGKIIYSSDGGETWNLLECGLRNIFYSVDFLNRQRGSVVGSDSAFALTTDAGKTWKTGIIDTTTCYAVKIIDENTIFASRKNTCIYKTTTFGDTWKKVFNGDSHTLENWFFFKDSIYNSNTAYYNSNYKFINSSVGFVVGVGPHILKTTDGGDSWQKVYQDSDSSLFSDVDFYDENLGIAVGGKMGWLNDINYFGLLNHAVLTTDGGKTWSKFDIPLEANYNGVKFYSDKYIYVVGGAGWSCVTKDKGYSWYRYHYIDNKYYRDNTNFYKDTSTNIGKDYFIQQPSFDSNGNILAISKQGSIFKSNDYGKNYQTIKMSENFDPTNRTFNFIFSIVNITNDKILIPGKSSKVFYSHDGGTSFDLIFPRYEINSGTDKIFWANITSDDAYLTTGYFKDSTFGFLAGNKTNNFPNTLITRDGGNIWEFTDNLNPTTKPFFISPTTGFVIDKYLYFDTLIKKNIPNYKIMKTTDAGTSWDSISVIKNPSELGVDCKPIQISFPDSITGFLSLYYMWVETDDSLNYPLKHKSVFKILKTNDFCRTFDTVSVLEYNQSSNYIIHFINKDFAYLIKVGNIVLKTTDSFKSFKELLLPGNYHLINDIYFLDENYGIAVGSQDTIFTTEDGGNSWNIEVLPFNRRFSGSSEWTYDFNSITRIKNGNIFLTGRGRIVRGIVVDSTDIHVNQETEGTYCPFYYVSVVPNPVLDIAKIKIIGLHYAQGKRLFLRIYDINGNFIKDLSVDANKNNDGQTTEFEANLHDLPNGIYFIELEANNLIRAQKFIKE